MILREDGAMIERVASDDATRPILSMPYLHGDRLEVTDGAAMVSYPVEREDGDQDGQIPGAVLIAARKLARKGPLPLTIKAGADALTLLDGSTSPRPNLGAFPSLEQVIPADKRKEMVLALDAGILLKIAEAINAPQGRRKGGRTITLRIAVDVVGEEVRALQAPIRVETNASKAAGVVALLMPMRS